MSHMSLLLSVSSNVWLEAGLFEFDIVEQEIPLPFFKSVGLCYEKLLSYLLISLILWSLVFNL